MRPWRAIKINIIRTKILKKYPCHIHGVYSSGPVGRLGVWTHGVIVMPYKSNQGVFLNTIQVIKTERLIMCIIKHVWGTMVLMEQYLWEHMKKGSWRIYLCRQYQLRWLDHASHHSVITGWRPHRAKIQVNKEGKNRDSVYPTQQDMKPLKKCTGNTTPPNKQTGLSSPRYEKKTDHTGCTYCDR